MSDLVELIYTSVTLAPLPEADIKDILKTSHRKNAIKGITGMLCYDGKRFLQILEGAPETIHALYDTINADPRHNAIELLHEGKIEDRCFSDWKMAYENIPQGMLDGLTERMAVLSFSEASEKVLDTDSSYGARLFGLFMQSEMEAAN